MRLTWRRADGAVCPRVKKGMDYDYIAGEFTQKVYDKLAAYEDAEEQGRLVEVVRCQECYFRRLDGADLPVCTGAMAYCQTPDDWFCAAGKSKDGGRDE